MKSSVSVLLRAVAPICKSELSETFSLFAAVASRLFPVTDYLQMFVFPTLQMLQADHFNAAAVFVVFIKVKLLLSLKGNL